MMTLDSRVLALGGGGGEAVHAKSITAVNTHCGDDYRFRDEGFF